MNNELVQFDTASKLQVTCVDENNLPIPLANCTVSLQFYINSFPPFSTKPMIVVDPVASVVEYQFGTSTDSNGDAVYDLSDAGVLYYRVAIQFQNGQILTSPQFGEIMVRPAIQ